MDKSSRVSVELKKKERKPDWMAMQPQWMASFRHLKYSLKSEDAKKVHGLLCELLKDENTTYRIFRLIGTLQGFFAILEYFSGYARRRGVRWADTNSSEAIESLAAEIRSCKRKTLE